MKHSSNLFYLFILFLFLSLGISEKAFCIEADELLVVYNSRMAGSKKLAKYYMDKRGIPPEHLIKTSTVFSESMEREEYDQKIVKPVREKLESLEDRSIAGIVLIYGVPLRVKQPLPSIEEENQVLKLKAENDTLPAKRADMSEEEKALSKDLDRQIKQLSGDHRQASVDSELALVKAENYSLDNWIPNPYFLGFQGGKTILRKNDVLLVCRIDGPDIDTAYRIIDDALATEKRGLTGVAYFDPKGPAPREEKDIRSGYTLYDASLHKAAEIVLARMDVVVDEKRDLFPPGTAPDTALYSGWYSANKYIDSFTWKQGAVGYHIASFECKNFRKENSNRWCSQVLKRGAAATVGPVHEPYVTAFPLPDLFFGKLAEGYLSLGEVYLITLPYLSWQMVLIGDPLYKPFAPLDETRKTTHSLKIIKAPKESKATQN